MRKTWVLRCPPSGVMTERRCRSRLGPRRRAHIRAPEGKLVHRLQAANEATDGVVAPPEAVFGREILVNALGAQALVKLGLDDVSPRLAIAESTASLADTVAGRSERRDSRVCCDFKVARAGGRMAGFCALWPAQVAGDSLAIDVQLDGDPGWTIPCDGRTR